MKKYEAQAHQKHIHKVLWKDQECYSEEEYLYHKDTVYKTSILLFFHKTDAENTSFSPFL